MRIVCAPDSFKESMTATEAAHAMERGILSVLPDAEVACVPMADGGEGTCATLAEAMEGQLVEVDTTDALGRPARAHLAVVHGERDADATGADPAPDATGADPDMTGTDPDMAVIEVAAACGLELVEPHLRDVAGASSAGVADLVRAALDRGVRTLVIGLGGSATNDAGAGMMTGLGARFLDGAGRELPPGGAALADLARVDLSGLDPRIAGLSVRLASDVDNPLLGERGASATFGPQKGAGPEDVARLDRALGQWADVVEGATRRDVRAIPGAGAAGGLGAAFLAFFDARLEPGADLVMDAVGLDRHLAEADYVFTGEGSLDAQSAAGKVPVRVAERARDAGVPVVLFAGRLDAALEAQPPAGARAAVPIVREVCDLDTALGEGAANLERATALACRLLCAPPLRLGDGTPAPA